MLRGNLQAYTGCDSSDQPSHMYCRIKTVDCWCPLTESPNFVVCTYVQQMPLWKSRCIIWSESGKTPFSLDRLMAHWFACWNFHNWAPPSGNISSGYVQTAEAQFCPQTESMNTIECFNGKQMPGWDFARMQADANPNMLRMFEKHFFSWPDPIIPVSM